jgi:hypothetical protein
MLVIHINVPLPTVYTVYNSRASYSGALCHTSGVPKRGGERHWPCVRRVADVTFRPSTEVISAKGCRVTTPFELSMWQCRGSTPVPCTVMSTSRPDPTVTRPVTDRKGVNLIDRVCTTQWTDCVSVIKTSQLMLYREIIAVCSQIHTKHIKTQSVPRSKHSVSVIKTSQLMLYREIIAVCSQIHTKHTNTLCEQNAES